MIHRLTLITLAALIAIGFALTAPDAQAVTVNNVTDNANLFFDDFETAPNGVSSAAALDFSGDYDPGATWSILEQNSPAQIQITDSTSPDPGPFQGSNYLRIFRNSTYSGHRAVANLSSTQTDTGDVIEVEFAVYVPDDGVNSRFQVWMSGTDGDTDIRAQVRPDGNGNVIAVGPAFALTDTGLDYTPDVWQVWTLSYAVDGITFDVEVAGVSATGFASYTSGDVAEVHLINGNTPDGSVYFDAIPEPASLALLGLLAVSLSNRGGLAALRRRR